MAELQRYLDDLAVEASRCLPPGDALVLLDEVRDHLHASVQARLELGDDPAHAQAKAVAAFGNARTVVRRESVARRTRRQPALMATLVVSGALLLPLSAVGGSTAAWGFLLTILVFLASAVAFAVTCEARRPWRMALRSGAAFWALSTLVLTALCAPYHGIPTGRATLARIAGFYADHAEARVRRQAKYDRLGWPSAALEAQTETDRVLFTTLSADARTAAASVDLPRSALWATLATTVFGAYLALLCALGVLCERNAAKHARGSRWDFWRPE